jgi:hypothetical protein
MKSFYSLIAFVYFVQGLFVCYSTNYLKLNLTDLGLSFSELAQYSSLLVIPFVLKIFYGPLLDFAAARVFGFYRKLALFSFLLLFLVTLFLSFGRALSPQFQVTGLFSIVFAMSLLDVIFDTLAVKEVHEQEQPISTPLLMALSRGLGFAVMALIGVLTEITISTPSQIIAFCAAITLPVALRIPTAPVSRSSSLSFAGILRTSFKVSPLFLVLVFSYGAFALTSESFLTVFMRSRQALGASGLATLVGIKTVGLLVALSVLYCFRAYRVLIASCGFIAALGMSFICVSFARAHTGINPELLYLLWGLFAAAAEASFLLLCFERAKGSAPATSFLIYMTVANLSLSFSERFFTPRLDAWGFEKVFFSMAGLGLLFALLLLYYLRPKPASP